MKNLVKIAQYFRELVKTAQATDPRWYPAADLPKTNTHPIPPPPPPAPEKPFNITLPETTIVGDKPKPFDITLPETTIVGDKPQAALPPIPKATQKQLSDLNVQWGIGVPLRLIDGKIGTATRAALDTFKKQMGMPANATDQDVFARIQSEHAKSFPA